MKQFDFILTSVLRCNEVATEAKQVVCDSTEYGLWCHLAVYKCALMCFKIVALWNKKKAVVSSRMSVFYLICLTTPQVQWLWLLNRKATENIDV